MDTQLKDYLLDIVKNTSALGPDTILKVVGTEDSTVVKASREDTTIILKATLNKVAPDLVGTFGLNNLTLLSGLLNFQGFKSKEGKVKLKRETKRDLEIPTEIVFEAPGAASASYRLMAEGAVSKVYSLTAAVEWAVTIEQPAKAKIAELAQLAGIYSGLEQRFSIRLKNKQLKFYIGKEDASNHKVNFTFAEEVEGEIPTSDYSWKIADLLSILKLTESAKSTFKIAPEGNILQIDIDTGLCKYEFSLPAAS